MKPKTRRLIEALRQYARPPFYDDRRPDSYARSMKRNPGPFTGAKPERDARAKELKAERQANGRRNVARAYRHYAAGRTARGNNCLNLPTIITFYRF